MDTDERNAADAAITVFWTAAGSEAPRRFGQPNVGRKAVSPLRSATAVQIYVERHKSEVRQYNLRSSAFICGSIRHINGRKKSKLGVFGPPFYNMTVFTQQT